MSETPVTMSKERYIQLMECEKQLKAEKEKNKILEQELSGIKKLKTLLPPETSFVILEQDKFNDNYINKNKIKEKLEEYEDSYMISDIVENDLKENYKLVITVLQELLEE